MRAGAGEAEIRFSPQLFPLEGFAGVHDLPHTGVLILEKGSRVAVASVEIVMLPDDLIQRCRQEIAVIADTTPENVWLHMTHAITTPHAPGGPRLGLGGDTAKEAEADPLEEEKQSLYEQAVLEAVREAAGRARYSLAPAQLGFAQAPCRLVRTRDVETPAGWWIGVGDEIPEQPLSVLAVRDLRGRLLGMLLHYAMKPCAIDNAWMTEGRRLVSADAPGHACRLLEKELGMPVLYAMGAAADLVPLKTAWYDRASPEGGVETVDEGVEAGLAYAEELGERLAQAAHALLKELRWHEPACLERRGESFSWPAKERLPMRPCHTAEFVLKGDVEVPVEVLVLGSIALVGGKPEMNALTAKQLQERSPCAHTLFLAMVNGGMKYMPDLASYAKPTWEALASLLMPGAAEEFVTRAAKLLTQ